MNEKNYLKVLEVIGEKIKDLELTICVKDYEIKNLQEKLKAAEEEKNNEVVRDH